MMRSDLLSIIAEVAITVANLVNISAKACSSAFHLRIYFDDTVIERSAKPKYVSTLWLCVDQAYRTFLRRLYKNGVLVD